MLTFACHSTGHRKDQIDRESPRWDLELIPAFQSVKLEEKQKQDDRPLAGERRGVKYFGWRISQNSNNHRNEVNFLFMNFLPF
jgi:hypothetical protein